MEQFSKTGQGRKKKKWTDQSQILKLSLWFEKLKKKNRPGPDDFIGKFNLTFREELTNIFSNYAKGFRGRDISDVILWGYYQTNIKSRERYHSKRKLEANVTDEHRCKNPQQNTSKMNLTIH